MPVRVREQLVTTEDNVDRGVAVRRDSTRVRVTWFCGDARSFSLDDLKAALSNIKTVEKYPDVWVNLTDTDGQTFAGRVEDGLFYANTRAGGGEGIPWEDLKRALKKATE